MRKLVRALLFSSGCLFFPASVSAGPVKSEKSVRCKDCDTFQKGVHRKVVPADDVVCIYFVQPRVDTVLLRLDLKDCGTRDYDKKRAGTSGRICVGRHWVAASKSIYVCDTDNNYLFGYADTATIASKPKHSRERGEEACLFGAEECRKRGYKFKS